MSGTPHLIERVVERMAELGVVPGAPNGTFPTGAVPPGIRLAQNAPVPNVVRRAVTAMSGAAAARDVDIPLAPTPAAVPELPPVSIAAMEAAGMVVAGSRRSRVAEEWRVVIGHLIRGMRIVQADKTRERLRNVLMVTSTKPEEGKSFSSLNIAGSMAMGGLADVLLMDIDSKPGALTERLGLGDRRGLFDMVADPALQPADLIIQTAIPGLAILPIGRASADGPASIERTVTRRVVMAIETVARQFADRTLVLDSAPCLATSDASTLAATVGQIAMIVEAERTQRNELEAALELLRPCPNITLVLNKVRLATTQAFGSYHYYGD